MAVFVYMVRLLLCVSLYVVPIGLAQATSTVRATSAASATSQNVDIDAETSVSDVSEHLEAVPTAVNATEQRETNPYAQLNSTEQFRITPAHLPDHVIGTGGPLVMDLAERKTVKYNNVDAINSAINAVAMTYVNEAKTQRGKAWMKRTTLGLSFQKDWKPLYSLETVQPLGHYDDTTCYVWFTQHAASRVADIGTTTNSGIGYRHISNDDRHLHGLNLFYDHRFTGRHGRMSVGYEYLSGESELRLNYYRGLSGDRILTSGTRERAIDGYTINYGTTFTNARWARVYGEAYHFTLKRGADKNGLRIGTELQLTPRVSIDVGYNKPEHASGSGYGKIMFRLAGADIAYFGGKHKNDTHTTVRSKMLDKVIRHNTVFVE